MDARNALRKKMRTARRALSPLQQKSASRNLLKHLKNTPQFRTAKHIALYLGNDGEIDPNEVVQWCWKQRKIIYLPVLHPLAHNRLWFVRYTFRTPLTKNCYGIIEPKSPYRFIRPAKALDTVLLPLVAFDTQGGRLGMGGGYYDRTFSFIRQFGLCKPRLIGLAHDFQKVEKLPVASWDVPLALVVTDAGIYSTNTGLSAN